MSTRTSSTGATSRRCGATSSSSAARTPQGQTLMRRNGYTYMWYREEFFDIDERLRVMDKQGIDMRVLSLSSPNVYDWQRRAAGGDGAADERRDRGDRARASRPLRRRRQPAARGCRASLAELDRIVGELGLHGVMIGSNVAGVQVNDRRFEPVWARIDELRLPVFEHPMFPPDTAEGGVRAAAAPGLHLRHHDGGGAAHLLRRLRALPEFPVHHGAYRRRAPHAARAPGQRLSPVPGLPQAHRASCRASTRSGSTTTRLPSSGRR